MPTKISAVMTSKLSPKKTIQSNFGLNSSKSIKSSTNNLITPEISMITLPSSKSKKISTEPSPTSHNSHNKIIKISSKMPSRKSHSISHSKAIFKASISLSASSSSSKWIS